MSVRQSLESRLKRLEATVGPSVARLDRDVPAVLRRLNDRCVDLTDVSVLYVELKDAMAAAVVRGAWAVRRSGGSNVWSTPRWQLLSNPVRTAAHIVAVSAEVDRPLPALDRLLWGDTPVLWGRGPIDLDDHDQGSEYGNAIVRRLLMWWLLEEGTGLGLRRAIDQMQAGECGWPFPDDYKPSRTARHIAELLPVSSDLPLVPNHSAEEVIRRWTILPDKTRHLRTQVGLG